MSKSILSSLSSVVDRVMLQSSVVYIKSTNTLRVTESLECRAKYFAVFILAEVRCLKESFVRRAKRIAAFRPSLRTVFKFSRGRVSFHLFGVDKTSTI